MTMRDANADRRRTVMDALTPVVGELGYDLEDVSITAAGKRSLVRVTVDSDAGVDLDEVSVVARAVSETLDQQEADGQVVFAGAYVLEVSSPGVDRKLTEPRHWRRARGRLVDTAADGRPVLGRVVAVDEAAGTVTMDVSGTEQIHDLASLAPGRIQVEFSRVSEADDLGEDDETADDRDADEATGDEVEG